MAIICPIPTCRAENNAQAESCTRCGTPLRNYTSLAAMPAQLFNQGLAEARAGCLGRARDLFAAVVYWSPYDLEARSALAAACFSLGDAAEARLHWEKVLARAPQDPVAKRGLAELAPKEPGPAQPAGGKRHHKKKS